MSRSAWLRVVCLLLIPGAASAQVLNTTGISSGSNLSRLQTNGIDVNLIGTTDAFYNGINDSPLENPNIALSKLDLKAPAKAQKEYHKGYQLLMKKQLPEAVQHLSLATSMYPSYVAAHNALGSAYMGLGQNVQARTEFAHAASLDDHLPNSFLNLGCAELALQDYPAAEKNIEKAATMAPLDLQLLTALAYSQFMNHDYEAVIATAHEVHDRKHPRAAMVHLYAAAAREAQGKPSEARDELETLLKEDPNSPAAAAARQLIVQLQGEASHPSPITSTGTLTLTSTVQLRIPQDSDQEQQNRKQDAKESAQLAEAEAECPNCGESSASLSSRPASDVVASAKLAGDGSTGYVFHASAEEVAVFFSAVDHGKPVSDLTATNITLRDDNKAPAIITGFRNEAQLPLRLGLVIDTSSSITKRFKFEQAAAGNFLKNVVTGKDDLAFLIGFANSVLLVQDFTDDQELMTHGIGELVPAGGTALWDAVSFAADKLRNRAEAQPVARILVVISDGKDNSSSATAKQAIDRAQRGGVTVYTVSTSELMDFEDDSIVGERALSTLADLTGGEAFTPISASSMNRSLKDLEQVIRSRYLISYKPADFKRDGQYHRIDITAVKNGHTLRVFSRKGYIASPSTSADPY